jgi:hypothetical protein
MPGRKGGEMRKLAILLMSVLVMVITSPVQGKTPYLTEAELQTEVQQGFEQILDLWRAGKYGDIYERTISSGKETKERFVERLADAPLKPACCWEKMQDVKVTVKGDSAVLVRARIGLEGSVETTSKTRSFKLVKEDGVWKISQADLLALSGAVKKKSPYKKKKKYYSSSL